MLSEIKIVTRTREILRITTDKVSDPELIGRVFRDISLKTWMEIQQTGVMLTTLRKISLGQDTTAEERQEALEQAKDLARTVPAFGIFMLPGGALLLPLVAKVVPWRMLPSSFESESDVEQNKDKDKGEDKSF
ncbi:MAG: hypothetical protein H8D24_02740 [Gammaproteobacteria bacterium]|uniref:Letm1 RBD domain-containing protein n=1 Tax=Candidatus Thiopontia autotrophica TaxID=2841688 RepID=A0A8J6NYT9_9GAMM|nr:hypothetical protein [Candidatus Thiopontia autotrophica]MBL6969201.1 hypothetical protein [Gammaproteobacteria bacterium]